MPDERDPSQDEQDRRERTRPYIAPSPRKRSEIEHDIGSGGPNGRAVRSSFLKSFVPTFTIACLSLFGEFNFGFYYFWFLAAIVGAIVVIWALVSVAIYVLTWPIESDKSEGSKVAGVMAGASAGMLALAATCFINLPGVLDSSWN